MAFEWFWGGTNYKRQLQKYEYGMSLRKHWGIFSNSHRFGNDVYCNVGNPYC